MYCVFCLDGIIRILYFNQQIHLCTAGKSQIILSFMCSKIFIDCQKCFNLRKFLPILCETDGDLIPAKLGNSQITKCIIKHYFLDRGHLDKQIDV